MSNINVIVTNLNDVHRILDSFERKKRGYDDIVYPKKYKTPVTIRSDYLVQHDHPLTLEGFLEERNKLVMRLDENSKKRLRETTHPPQFNYPYHVPNLTPYNMYGGTSQYSQVATVHNPTVHNPTVHNPNYANTNDNAINYTDTGHSENSTADSHSPERGQQQQKKKQSLPSSPELFRGFMNEIDDERTH